MVRGFRRYVLSAVEEALSELGDGWFFAKDLVSDVRRISARDNINSRRIAWVLKLLCERGDIIRKQKWPSACIYEYRRK